LRRLLVLVGAVAALDAIFFAALVPLLPVYAHRLGLSKTDAGLLTACYGAGVIVGAVPAGILTARVGAKFGVTAGLALISGSSFLFGFTDAVRILDAARFAQGFGGAVCWTAGLAWLVAATPAATRGQSMGIVIGMAIAGSLLGPMLGAAAASFGVSVVFSAVAVAGITLAVLALQTPSPPQSSHEQRPIAGMYLACRQRLVLTGLWLTALSALAAGVISVLAPLTLDRLGFGSAAIGLVFLVAGVVSAVSSPAIGRWSDRSGPLGPVAVCLVGGICALAVLPWMSERVILAGVLMTASVAFGSLLVPGMTLFSDGVTSVGLDEGLGFGLMNLGWAPGQMLGAAAAGVLASAWGNALPYLLVAAVCLATLGALRLGHGRLQLDARRARGPARGPLLAAVDDSKGVRFEVDLPRD
jgi:predicted MFS family arabinose efflux permease